MGFLIRMAITAFGLWLAARLVPGIQITPDATLALAALLLGFVNAFVRPIAIFLTFPITLVTLGLFLWVVNAGMLGLVAWMLQDFQIASLGAALIGSLVVSLTSWIGSSFIGSSGRYEVMVVRRG
ncbi:MAG: phage holin family protein [bacterium]|nr:phage holin family protein [bacterium]